MRSAFSFDFHLPDRRHPDRTISRELHMVWLEDEGVWRSIEPALAVSLAPDGDHVIFRRALCMAPLHPSKPDSVPKLPEPVHVRGRFVGYRVPMPHIDGDGHYLAFGWSDQWPPTNSDERDNDQPISQAAHAPIDWSLRRVGPREGGGMAWAPGDSGIGIWWFGPGDRLMTGRDRPGETFKPLHHPGAPLTFDSLADAERVVREYAASLLEFNASLRDRT